MFDSIYNILCAGRPAFEGIKVPRRPEFVQLRLNKKLDKALEWVCWEPLGRPCLKITKGGEKPRGEE